MFPYCYKSMSSDSSDVEITGESNIQVINISSDEDDLSSINSSDERTLLSEPEQGTDDSNDTVVSASSYSGESETPSSSSSPIASVGKQSKSSHVECNKIPVSHSDKNKDGTVTQSLSSHSNKYLDSKYSFCSTSSAVIGKNEISTSKTLGNKSQPTEVIPQSNKGGGDGQKGVLSHAPGSGLCGERSECKLSEMLSSIQTLFKSEYMKNNPSTSVRSANPIHKGLDDKNLVSSSHSNLGKSCVPFSSSGAKNLKNTCDKSDLLKETEALVASFSKNKTNVNSDDKCLTSSNSLPRIKPKIEKGISETNVITCTSISNTTSTATNVSSQNNSSDSSNDKQRRLSIDSRIDELVSKQYNKQVCQPSVPKNPHLYFRQLWTKAGGSAEDYRQIFLNYLESRKNSPTGQNYNTSQSFSDYFKKYYLKKFTGKKASPSATVSRDPADIERLGTNVNSSSRNSSHSEPETASVDNIPTLHTIQQQQSGQSPYSVVHSGGSLKHLRKQNSNLQSSQDSRNACPDSGLTNTNFDRPSSVNKNSIPSSSSEPGPRKSTSEFPSTSTATDQASVSADEPSTSIATPSTSKCISSEFIQRKIQHIMDIFPDADRNWVSGQLSLYESTYFVIDLMLTESFPKSKMMPDVETSSPLLKRPWLHEKRSSSSENMMEVEYTSPVKTRKMDVDDENSPMDTNSERSSDDMESEDDESNSEETLPISQQPADLVCEVCSRGCKSTEVVQCTNGHLLCNKCLEKEAKFVLQGKKQGNIVCSKDSCEGIVVFTECKRVLPEIILDLLEEKLDKDNMDAIASMQGAVKCISCAFVVFMSDQEKEFQCKNSKCQKNYCRCCLKAWADFNHTKCDFEDTPYLETPDCDGVTNLPKHWSAMDQTNDSDYVLEQVSVDSLEYQQISKLFFTKSLGSIFFQQLKVFRIQNQNLWQKFSLNHENNLSFFCSRKQMINVLGKENLNEKRLFHGTNSKYIDVICREGFDWRVCGKNGIAYGEGCYFAKSAMLSHRYIVDNPGKNKLPFTMRPSSSGLVPAQAFPQAPSFPSSSGIVPAPSVPSSSAGMPPSSAVPSSSGMPSSSTVPSSSRIPPAFRGPQSSSGLQQPSWVPHSSSGLPAAAHSGLPATNYSYANLPHEGGRKVRISTTVVPPSHVSKSANLPQRYYPHVPLPLPGQTGQQPPVQGNSAVLQKHHHKNALLHKIQSSRSIKNKEGKPFRMIVARVLAGKYTVGNSSYRRPPQNHLDPNGRAFNSCVDNESNPHIFVIFDNSQCYPEFVIEYK